MKHVERPSMPRLADIAAAWSDLPAGELGATFPKLRAFDIGWVEPFCFRCGWLAPTRDANSYPEDWKWPRRFDAAWNAAGGWLERAHLHDVRKDGDSDPLNLVPMCPLCHESQPICGDREGGIAFVNLPPDHLPMVGFAQIISDGRYRNRTNPGRDAHRLLLRAYADAGVALAKARQAVGEVAA